LCTQRSRQKTAIILIENDRWSRLERFARWKSYRLPLYSLPNDILELIVFQLYDVDLQNFVHAILGFRPNIEKRQDAFAVPIQIRRHWIADVVLSAFRSHLITLYPSSLCNNVFGTVVVANWTSFARNTKFEPLADYSWSRFRKTCAPVVLNDEIIKAIITKCYSEQSCAVRLTLHTYVEFDEVLTINPFPVSYHIYYVFPFHVFS
jgi:hypothetical protein